MFQGSLGGALHLVSETMFKHWDLCVYIAHMVIVVLVECKCLGEELVIFFASISTWDGLACLVDMTRAVCGEGSESS